MNVYTYIMHNAFSEYKTYSHDYLPKQIQFGVKGKRALKTISIDH